MVFIPETEQACLRLQRKGALPAIVHSLTGSPKPPGLSAVSSMAERPNNTRNNKRQRSPSYREDASAFDADRASNTTYVPLNLPFTIHIYFCSEYTSLSFARKSFLYISFYLIGTPQAVLYSVASGIQLSLVSRLSASAHRALTTRREVHRPASHRHRPSLLNPILPLLSLHQIFFFFPNC